MFEYADLTCSNPECDLHGQVQGVPWQRVDGTNRDTEWLSAPYCRECRTPLKDYVTHIKESHPDGYTAPLTIMRCHNKKCESYGVDELRNFNAYLRGIKTGTWLHADDGKCHECSVPMLTIEEWDQVHAPK